MSFPCYMYHHSKGTRLFQNAEEFSVAGEGWVDSPAKLGGNSETPTREPDPNDPSLIDPPAGNKDIDQLTKKELIELAESLDLDINIRDKKETIMAAILAASVPKEG